MRSGSWLGLCWGFLLPTAYSDAKLRKAGQREALSPLPVTAVTSNPNVGRRHACRRLFLVAYAVVVILLATYLWNVLLLALLFGRPSRTRPAGPNRVVTSV